MKYYKDYLIKNKYKVLYKNYNSKITIKEYTIYDPIDKIDLPNSYTLIESPGFLLTKVTNASK